jgi:hypothetical protein
LLVLMRPLEIEAIAEQALEPVSAGERL